MTEYRKGTPADWADIIDFGNYVFSQAHAPHDFKRLIPKVYSDQRPENAGFHCLALENGHIRGMIASYPHDYRIEGETLNVRFIGTVSVHPYARGSGYMKHLMSDINELNEQTGADLSILGGQRQRYRYFGYENGGMTIKFNLSRPNLKHGAGPLDERISLMPVEPDDTELIALLYPFYLKGAVTGRTEEEFYDILKTWNSRPYAVFEDTECVGYIVASNEGDRIPEIRLRDESRVLSVLKAYMEWYFDGSAIQVAVPAYEKGIIEALSNEAETVSVTSNLQYKIYHWDKVLLALLKLKARSGPLKEGQLVLGIGNYGSCRIEVRQGEISVTKTDLPAELTLSENEAVLQLTSPEAWYRPVPRLIETGWFPLNFGMLNLDEF